MTSPLKQVSEEKSVRVPVPDELYEVSTEEFLRDILREKLRDVPAALERSAAA